MGKHLQSKYSDVSRNIIKSLRKGKSRARLRNVGNEKISNVHKNKRKYRGLDDTNEPLPKLRKLSEELVENDLNLSLENDDIEDSRNFQDGNEIVENKVYVEFSESCNDTYLKEDEDHHKSFFVEELGNNYFNLIVKDLYFHVIDEICLEGLDGITLEAFWKRLLFGLEGPLDINRNLKEYIWTIIRRNENLKFYELPQPRKELQIHDRFSYLDSNLGVVTELACELTDLYPHKLVSAPNVTGSCSTFDERIDVSDIIKNMSLEQVETYGQKLLLVASQSLRTLALFSELADPCIEMQSIEYCILERIGRSRKHGESTQGNLSLSSVLKMDPKSVFHYKKLLHTNHLISKQFFYMKSLVTDQNKSGRLLQLQRFHTTVKTKRLKIVEKVVDILKKQPGYRMDISQIKNFLGSDILALRKIFKSQKFRKIVKTDAIYPYRFMYPDARRSEYMKKSGSGEKVVRCFELRNPFLNIASSWDNGPEDSDEDDECEDESEPTGGKFYNKVTMPDVYDRIFMSGEEGSSAVKLRRLLEVDRNTCRNSLRKLFHKRVINIQKLDHGKQRKMLYRATCFKEDKEDTEELPLSESPGTPGKNRAKLIERMDLPIQKNKPKFDILNLYSVNLKIDKLQIPNCQFLVKKISSGLKFNVDMKEAGSNFGFTRDIIKLTYRQSNIDELLNFKDIVKISCPVPKPIIKSNFQNFHTTKADIDWITKLLLLKATFGEICINSESLYLDRQKRKYSEISIPKLYEQALGSSAYCDQKLQYMGDNPVIVFEENEREINVVITASTSPPAFNLDKVYPKVKFQTERVAIRIQIILDQINKKKIIEDLFRLAKSVTDEENKTGYEKKIDRKSVARLLKILVAEGYIRIYKVIITNSDITKTIVFICHPSIEYTNDSIQTSIQQLKWKYFIGCVKKSIKTNIPTVQKKLEETLKKKVQSPFAEIDVMSSIKELKTIEKLKMNSLKCKATRHTARLYGVKPKFVRMRLLHEVLFYLIYEYKSAAEPLNMKEVKDLFQSYRIELSEKEFQELPKIYTKEISWKMFIPPLPRHERWIDGWALLCDVILRLPVSILCKVHACVYESPELVETLHHPIKRFYLVKDLPEKIRNVLLYKRKYLFSVHESISKLNYCGLLQYGPKKQKEKDQIFVYLNQRASILNTTSSEPAYHQIEDKEYPQLPFFFNSQADLDDYWYNLNAISTNTKLNARNAGELVTMVDVSAKPELMKYTLSKTPETAIRDDNGEIPGDRRGAAGMDSSLWSHLTRNWFWSNSKPKDNPVRVKAEPLEETTVSKCRKVFLHKKPKNNQHLKIPMKLKQTPTKTSKKLLKYTRKITERPKKKRREYYDKLDRQILKSIGFSRRMKWSQREDTVLMLCKVGDLFLCSNKYKKQVVAYHVIRDIVHRVSPESKNKTSRAIQRRLKKLSVYPYEKVPNLHKVQAISEYFSVLVNNIFKGTDELGEPFRLSEPQINAAFVFLMACIFAHEKEVTDALQGNKINVDHLSEYNLEYTVKESIELDTPSYKFEDAKNEDDVKKNILKSVIHSSLATKDQSNVALQLLKVYQKYPDQLIRSAVEELKLSNTISYKKKVTVKKDNIWQAPFHLSQGYVFFQFTTFNIPSAIEAYETFLALRDQSENGTHLNFTEETINTKRYGQLLGLNEFRSFWNKLKFEFDLPQNVIILNPRINDHSELIRELALRYQLKLKKQKENKENEQEVESDSQRSKFSSDLDRITPKDETLTSDNNGMDDDDIQNSALDLTVDNANTDTIDRLKTWVTDCIGADKERSPSPEFIDWDRQLLRENAADETTIPIEQTSVYSKPGDERDHFIEEINMTEKKMAEEIPTLEEIEEEMLRLSSSEDRRIPYITDLSDLLNKDNSSDLPTDEKTLKQLKNHFITQYATLKKVVVEESEKLPESILELVENKLKNEMLWNKIEKDIVIEKMLPFEEVVELLVKEGGTREDIDLMQKITEFVLGSDIFGASGQQLKEKFSSCEKKVPLTRIITILTEAGIFLQTGICTIVFVHYKFQSFWLAETYQMTEEEQTVLLKIKEEKENEVLENQLSQKKMIMVKVMPWNKIDGYLNRETFKIWLCNVLSHCLDHPKIMYPKLCEKFRYLKPVDIYYCLQILQELSCIELFVYEEVENTIFSEWKLPEERSATILDDLKNCFIDVHNTAMICLGSFLYGHHES